MIALNAVQQASQNLHKKVNNPCTLKTHNKQPRAMAKKDMELTARETKH